MTPNRTLVKSTVAVAIGGLLFGFDTAVISGTTGPLTRYFGLSPAGLGLTVSIALWGTVTGALLAGLPGDRLGRRDSLRLIALLYLISALGSSLAWDWNALVFFRFVSGLAIGGSSVLAPMYIAEIAPARWRGRLVGLFQFNIVAGILLAYLSNYLIARALPGPAEWRWKFGIAAAPAALFLVMLFVIPRSPRWLAQKGQTAEARAVLEQIGETDPDARLEEILSAARLERQYGQQRLFAAKNRWPVFLAVSIAMFNQLRGSTRFCITSTIFLRAPVSIRYRAICKLWPLAPPTWCSPCWRCPSSTAWEGASF